MNEWNTLEAFVIKRKYFAQENEIRAVTSLPDDHLGEKVLSEVDKERERVNPSKPRIVNPKELTDKGKYVSSELDILIENIYVSPSAEKWFKEVVESLVSKYGLSKNVIKSDLYTAIEHLHTACGYHYSSLLDFHLSSTISAINSRLIVCCCQST